ncbi:hypothetical protein B0A50_00919 [Salinomyces thailandicus]|uniref:Uncharacterized protein n=1 Tax=Salinomyces thailandicus TaxID=706561 RepID=A0A4U0UFG0_9PEZI|nr:hypothetical protein B0A50_00919 [Salinomyces thailandica]
MEAGGFLLSPAPSTASTTTNSNATLPQPRPLPLKPGGTKESTFIRYVDTRILHIQRRFAKRTTPQDMQLSDIDREKADAWGDVKGYSKMSQACRDIEDLVGVVWVSGTPSLQVPYLINLAVVAGNVVTAMPPNPRSLFRVLGKLDHAFASLIQGRDIETGEALPGFEGRRAVSATEKVRIRSLVERTRVATMAAYKRGEFESEVEEVEDEADDEGGLVLENEDPNAVEEGEDSYDMQLARVYDLTMQEVGGSLEEGGIGIVTELRG